MSRTEGIEAKHLKRKAIVYIRQSTMRQVFVNTESAVRQYALKERLGSLGWEEGMIDVIDCDLGRSGAETTGRDGFRRMMADVGEGNVGAIACIECSRLSRSSADWSRLMEICALSDTILIDDDGIYNPNDFNDRLLLGLKGTMSEAELHFLRERMRGGALSKAKRGELRCLLPVGYVYDEAGNVVKDPDLQVQASVTMFFESFRMCGSAHRLAVYYSEKGYLFPANRSRGFGRPDIHWDVLTPWRACHILHSPTYAGIYTYGKIQVKHTAKGKKLRSVPEEQWISNIENHHEAYITVEEYRANQSALLSNTTHDGASPPREGNSLVQGIAICSRCGSKMFVAHSRDGYWQYACRHRQKDQPYTNRKCLGVNGSAVDGVISEVVLRRLTPEAVKAAGEVLCELEKRKRGEDGYFAMQVEKAKYEADLARKRYMNADPENRLVCAELERLWNERINQLAQAEAELRKSRAKAESALLKTDMEKLLALPEKLRQAWSGDTLRMTDKKRIVRCLIEDVALNMLGDEIHIGIRFKGGMTESINIPRLPSGSEKYATDPEIVEYIREASKVTTLEEIVESLNSAGKKTGTGLSFTVAKASAIRQRYGIPTYKDHLRSIGYLTTEDKAKQLGVSVFALNQRRLSGELRGQFIMTRRSGGYMYQP